jgi:hypothetical protein|tara:strand:+ start:255 stop:431 length:177 start_codon:yes stop_codon:yes gene_type:complete
MFQRRHYQFVVDTLKKKYGEQATNHNRDFKDEVMFWSMQFEVSFENFDPVKFQKAAGV